MNIRKRVCCFKHCGHCMMCGSIHVLEALSELPPQEIEEAFLSIDESMPLSEESLEDFQKFFSYYERAGDYKRSRWMHWVPVLERLENTIDVNKIKEYWKSKSKNSSECMFTLLLNEKMLHSKLYPYKNNGKKAKYNTADFDGRGKYQDTDEEI